MRMEKKPDYRVDETGKQICYTCEKNITHNKCPCTPIAFKIHKHRERLGRMIREDTSRMKKKTIEQFEKEIGASLSDFKKKCPKKIVNNETGEILRYGKTSGCISLDHIIPPTAPEFNIINNPIHERFLFNINNIIPIKIEKNSAKSNKYNKNEIDFILIILSKINITQVDEAHQLLIEYREMVKTGIKKPFLIKINGKVLKFDKEENLLEEIPDEIPDETQEEIPEETPEETPAEKELKILENISKEIEKQKAKLKESIAKEKQNEEWNKMKHIIYDKEFGKKKRAIKVLRAKRRIPEYMIQIPNSWKDIEEEWERDMEETLKANYFNTK